MLKITQSVNESGIGLKVEGRLAGPWVHELEKQWKSIHVLHRGTRVWVNLQAVTYVDQCGQDLLKRIYQQGGRFSVSGCLMRAIVEGMTNG
ncbi:MAG: hypothetical protein MRJ96_00560 [Nitrospirales bacterium]|nr:hypothetical protein [Nitrospira sp.]MDR4499931.1 hypothetical protein [Nitrospirales bacterium]